MSKRRFGVGIKQHPWAIYALVFGVIGVGALIATRAASNSSSIDPEHDSLSGNVQIVDDTSASGGGAVKFLAGAVAPPGSIFTDTFNSLGNWTFASWTYENVDNRPNPQSGATIDGGKLKIADYDQNYGEAAVRSAVKYNLSQGGTVKFDVSLYSGNIPSSSTDPGWPWIGFLPLPYSAPSTPCCNGGAPVPQSGIYIRFIKTCILPWTFPFILDHSNYVESSLDPNGNCLNTFTMAASKLNRVELRYTPGRMEIWISDASADGTTFGALKHIQDYDVTLPPNGYVYLGSHNHASLKYSCGDGLPCLASVDTWFDNVSYPAGVTTNSYPNGQGVNLSGATSARVAFTATYYPNSSPPAGAAVIVNGHSYPFTPAASGSLSVLGTVPINISDLISGNNTITVQGFTKVGNISLVVEQ